MNDEIRIAGRLIGKNHPPYVIAELSANHNGDIERAYKIMEAAKEAGADAIKLQTYTADTITMDCQDENFMIRGGLWDGRSLYELYQGASLPWEWHSLLFEKASSLNIPVFSTPFDYTAIDLLESLNTPAYKIASFEVIDLPLIKRVAETGKPMIISTGMASKDEIQDAVDTARGAGCNELVVLHCVSEYPAPAANYNLATIREIESTFQVIPGLSDHTIDNATATAAVAMGACVIEKHVTLDRNGGGPDDSFSLEPQELKRLCADTKTAWEAIGRATFNRSIEEQGNIKFRRSLFVVKDIIAGDKFTHANVRSIRPGMGLPPKMLFDVIGKTATQDLAAGQPLSLEHINS